MQWFSNDSQFIWIWATSKIITFEYVVQDCGCILNRAHSDKYWQYSWQHLAWEHDHFLFGQHYTSDRKVIWYGDDNFQYHYFGSLKQGALWQPALYQEQTKKCVIASLSFGAMREWSLNIKIKPIKLSDFYLVDNWLSCMVKISLIGNIRWASL